MTGALRYARHLVSGQVQLGEPWSPTAPSSLTSPGAELQPSSLPPPSQGPNQDFLGREGQQPSILLEATQQFVALVLLPGVGDVS